MGKTHPAVALGLAAIDRSSGVYFAQANRGPAGGVRRARRIYLAPKLLIIDEPGYLPVDKVGATVFGVVARYELGTFVLTSNQTFTDSGEAFGDLMIATAILDRRLHHSHVINIRGERHRLREKRRSGLFSSIVESEKDA